MTTVLLSHGGGGEATRRLIAEHILPRLGNPALDTLTDGAVLPPVAGRLCVTTDASVVRPLEFPGGDIGRLAVSGTVNDLAVMGARPLALTMSLIIEEGLPLATLDRILDSVAATAREAGVAVVAGDTKVVERHHGDGLLISTAGVGVIADGLELGVKRIHPGDRVLVTGTMADHGLAIMASREGLGLDGAITSDVTPLADLCATILAHGPAIHFLRDPTRGGLAGVLADLAEDGGCSLDIEERAIPIATATRHVAEMLGIDPLGVANEGKLVVVCAADAADAVLATCRRHRHGAHAAIIGTVTNRRPALAELLTTIGGRRIISRPFGEELPRIC
jgi:hydrogenase expression/formation protein HypE